MSIEIIVQSRIDDVIEENFLNMLLDLHLKEDQLYNCLYYILFESGNMSVDEALLDATNENFPYIQDSDNDEYLVRKLAVMLTISDLNIKSLNDELKKLVHEVFLNI